MKSFILEYTVEAQCYTSKAFHGLQMHPSCMLQHLHNCTLEANWCSKDCCSTREYGLENSIACTNYTPAPHYYYIAGCTPMAVPVVVPAVEPMFVPLSPSEEQGTSTSAKDMHTHAHSSSSLPPIECILNSWNFLQSHGSQKQRALSPHSAHLSNSQIHPVWLQMALAI